MTSGGTNLPAEEAGVTESSGDRELRVERRNQPGAGGGIGRRFSALLDRLCSSRTLESDPVGTDPDTL